MGSGTSILLAAAATHTRSTGVCAGANYTDLYNNRYPVSTNSYSNNKKFDSVSARTAGPPDTYRFPRPPPTCSTAAIIHIPQQLKYPFQIKRILLTRDPKDHCANGSSNNRGFGVEVMGGRPMESGHLGASVSGVQQHSTGSAVTTLGEVKIGDQVLEWNGIPLTDKTAEQVNSIVYGTNYDEVEVVLRSEPNHIPESRSRAPHIHSTYSRSFENLNDPRHIEHSRAYSWRSDVADMSRYSGQDPLREYSEGPQPANSWR